MTAPTAVSVLVTCEHGGNQVPAEYRAWFLDAGDALASHRGWDAGALPLAGALGRGLAAPVRSATVTRLLVDLNRSPHNPRVFSEYTRGASREERRHLIATYHAPHREAVAQDVDGEAGPGRTVIHLGVHSFTPSWNGAPRRPDLSLLYDPARPEERALCAAWVDAMRVRHPGWAIHRNDPYRGAADGLTTWLRRRHPASRYLGIEVEVNQKHRGEGGRFPPVVTRCLLDGFREALERLGWPTPAASPY